LDKFHDSDWSGDEPKAGTTRHATDWGQAALLLGGVLLLLAPLMMIVMILAVAIAVPLWGPSEIRTVSIVFAIPLVCLVALSILSLIAAILGLKAAVSRRQPAGLPVSGLLVGLVALLFSLINLVANFLIADDMIRLRQNRFPPQFRMSAPLPPDRWA
jgi:hypothetical protein